MITLIFIFFILSVHGTQVFRVYQPGRNSKEGCTRYNGCYSADNPFPSLFWEGYYVLGQARYVISWDILRSDLLLPGDKVAIEVIEDRTFPSSNAFITTLAHVDPEKKRYIWIVKDNDVKLHPYQYYLYILLTVFRNGERVADLNSDVSVGYFDEFQIGVTQYACDRVATKYRYNCPCETDADCEGQYAVPGNDRDDRDPNRRAHCAVYAHEGFDSDGVWRYHTRQYCATDSSQFGYLCPVYDFKYSKATDYCWRENIYSTSSCYKKIDDWPAQPEWQVCQRSVYQFPLSSTGAANECTRLCVLYPGRETSAGPIPETQPPATDPISGGTTSPATADTADPECMEIDADLALSLPHNTAFCDSLRLGRCNEFGRFETLRFCDTADDCVQVRATLQAGGAISLISEAFCRCPSNYVAESGTGDCVCPPGLVPSLNRLSCVPPSQTTIAPVDLSASSLSASAFLLDRTEPPVDYGDDDAANGSPVVSRSESMTSNVIFADSTIDPDALIRKQRQAELPDWLWGAVAGGTAAFLACLLCVVFCCVRAYQERRLSEVPSSSRSARYNRRRTASGAAALHVFEKGAANGATSTARRSRRNSSAVALRHSSSNRSLRAGSYRRTSSRGILEHDAAVARMQEELEGTRDAAAEFHRPVPVAGQTTADMYPSASSGAVSAPNASAAASAFKCPFCSSLFPTEAQVSLHVNQRQCRFI